MLSAIPQSASLHAACILDCCRWPFAAIVPANYLPWRSPACRVTYIASSKQGARCNAGAGASQDAAAASTSAASLLAAASSVGVAAADGPEAAFALEAGAPAPEDVLVPDMAPIIAPAFAV